MYPVMNGVQVRGGGGQRGPILPLIERSARMWPGCPGGATHKPDDWKRKARQGHYYHIESKKRQTKTRRRLPWNRFHVMGSASAVCNVLLAALSACWSIGLSGMTSCRKGFSGRAAAA